MPALEDTERLTNKTMPFTCIGGAGGTLEDEVRGLRAQLDILTGRLANQ
jgi:hypothetical protein